MKLFSRAAEPSTTAASEQREPLLDRQASRHSYGAASSPARAIHRPESERARSRRRRARIRSSVYAEPPASYRRALVTYTFAVTLSSAIFLVLFGALKMVAWPHELQPSPIREFLLAAGAWVVAFSLRIPILFVATLFNTYVNRYTVMLSTVLQVALQEVLRLAILILIQLHLERPGRPVLKYFFENPAGGEPDLDWAPVPDVWDTAFTQVWWIGMGWATIDVAVGISQGYEQLSLYRDVLARERSHASPSNSPPRIKRSRSNIVVHPAPPQEHQNEGIRSTSNLLAPPSRAETDFLDDSASHDQQYPEGVLSATPRRMLTNENVGGTESVVIASRDLEAELSHLITRKQRAELEEVYGSPLPRIPVFLIALQRLDSILLSLGLTLLISSAYLRALYLPALSPSEGSAPGTPPTYAQNWEVDWVRVKDTTLPMFGGVVLVHFLLSILWIEALPRIGVHTASYVGLLVSLAAFFAGLGYWGALV